MTQSLCHAAKNDLIVTHSEGGAPFSPRCHAPWQQLMIEGLLETSHLVPHYYARTDESLEFQVTLPEGSFKGVVVEFETPYSDSGLLLQSVELTVSSSGQAKFKDKVVRDSLRRFLSVIVGGLGLKMRHKLLIKRLVRIFGIQ